MRVYVGGVPTNVDAESLRQRFSRFGRVLAVTVPRVPADMLPPGVRASDAPGRGYCFVDFADDGAPAALKAAKKAFKRTVWAGKAVTIERSRDPGCVRYAAQAEASSREHEGGASSGAAGGSGNGPADVVGEGEEEGEDTAARAKKKAVAVSAAGEVAVPSALNAVQGGKGSSGVKRGTRRRCRAEFRPAETDPPPDPWGKRKLVRIRRRSGNGVVLHNVRRSRYLKVRKFPKDAEPKPIAKLDWNPPRWETKRTIHDAGYPKPGDAHGVLGLEDVVGSLDADPGADESESSSFSMSWSSFEDATTDDESDPAPRAGGLAGSAVSETCKGRGDNGIAATTDDESDDDNVDEDNGDSRGNGMEDDIEVEDENDDGNGDGSDGRGDNTGARNDDDDSWGDTSF